MSATEKLRQIALRGDKQAFDRGVFEYLLTLWNGRIPPPHPEELAELIPLLARWLRAAPLKTPLDRLRILTARKSLLCLVHAHGGGVDAFLESALGALPPLDTAPAWMRQKLALMASIDSSWTPEMEAWHRISPEEAMTHTIVGLHDEPISSPGLARFNSLVKALPRLTPVRLPYPYLADLAYANFIVSYATEPNKYAGKRVLGAQARQMLQDRGFLREAETRSSPPARTRPCVAVVVEKLLGGNMMHRCYGQQIAELKRDFDVTLFAEEPSRCPAHAELAHQVHYFDPNPEKLGELVNMVLAAAPDAIYYPSVSMTPWTFALSQLRLAPLQIAGIGHPCPTASPVIDYQAMQRDIWSPDGAAFEPPLLFDSHALSADFCFSEEVAQLHEARLHRAPRASLVVAINSSSMKLNAEFLATLRELVDRCAEPVQLRFFPVSTGVRHPAIARRIHAWFPDAEVLEATDFKRYLGLLSDCDIALQAFPFGGTNTTIDALALGLPIVCLDGPEIHTRIDSTILAASGVAPELLAKDRANYLQIALRLVNNDDDRMRIGTLARAGVLAMLRAPAVGSTFADALKSVLNARTGSGVPS